MRSASESVRHVIRVNATSIDVTSSNAIAFGYVNEIARPGRMLAGRHRLISLLPEPGSQRATGSIWRAESARSGTPVMVELLDPAIGEDAGLSDTFEWEARAAAAVGSPFVNRVLDFGVEGSTPYLVTQLPCGETLAEGLAAQRRPTLPELERMFREVALALDEMHALDLVHRDLRSERIFLYRAPGPRPAERHVASLSFGISKLMNDTLDLVRTMARRAITPADIPRYTSPEQVLGTLPIGPRSDLWSLAVIAFECMTGEMPFVGATLAEQLVQICTEEPRVPSTLAEVPRGFDGWFTRGVHKSPEMRWGSALEMADALSSVLGC
jgi:eukaryotic-like serine/threonine-protein kinase